MLILFSVPSFLPVASQVIVRDQSLSLLQWFNNYNFQKYNDAIDGLVPNGSLMFNENLEHNQCCPAISTFHSWLVLVSVSFFRSMGRPIDRSESSNVRVRIGKNRRLWALGPAVFRFIWHESIRVLFFSSFFFKNRGTARLLRRRWVRWLGPVDLQRCQRIDRAGHQLGRRRLPSARVVLLRAGNRTMQKLPPDQSRQSARRNRPKAHPRQSESSPVAHFVGARRCLWTATSASFFFLKLSNRILMNGFEHWFLRYVPFCPIAYFFLLSSEENESKSETKFKGSFLLPAKTMCTSTLGSFTWKYDGPLARWLWVQSQPIFLWWIEIFTIPFPATKKW